MTIFRIGEFAKLAGVTVRSLRHYDNIGLLTADYIDPQTNYRYYTSDQLNTLHQIQYWQSLNFPLEQIRDLLHVESTDDWFTLLCKQREQLQKELRQQQRRLAELQCRIQSIEKHGTQPDHQFVIKELPAENIMSIQSVLSDDDDAINSMFWELIGQLQSKGINIPYTMGLKHWLQHIRALEDYENVTYLYEWAFRLPDIRFEAFPLSPNHKLTTRQLMPVRAACLFIRGSYAQSSPLNNGFWEWAKQHGYKVNGPVREHYLRVVDYDITHPDNLMIAQYPISSF